MRVGEIYKKNHTDEYIIIKNEASGLSNKVEIIIANSLNNTCEEYFSEREALIKYLEECTLIN